MNPLQNFIFLVKREFGLFFRNQTLRTVFLAGPLIYALLFGFVYQQGKVMNLPVIVVDKDNSPASNQLLEMLHDNEVLKVISVRHDNTDLKKSMIRQNASALMIIPDRFEADLLQKRYPEIVTYVNTANMMTANFSTKAIQTILGTYSAGISIKTLQKKGLPQGIAATQYEPFKANYIRLYNQTGNYFLFMWPAMLAVILQQVILLAMAVSFAAEFEKQSFATEFLTRTRSPFGSILVKVTPVWILSAVNVLVFYVLHHVFHAPVPHNAFNFAAITSLFVASVSFLGVFISVLLPEALKATQVLMLVSTPSFIIGGFTWPREAMPAAVQYFSDVIPLTPFLQAFKILLIQEGDLSDTLPYLQHLSILTLVYGLLSLVALKIKIANLAGKTLNETT